MDHLLIHFCSLWVDQYLLTFKCKVQFIIDRTLADEFTTLYDGFSVKMSIDCRCIMNIALYTCSLMLCIALLSYILSFQ